MSAESRRPSPDLSTHTIDIRAALSATLDLDEGEALERAYLFETVERRDVSFTLTLVTKRLADARLEMVAVGGRVGGEEAPTHDFVRRARFPDDVLPRILAEFIDRCGVEGALYREVPLVDEEDPDAALDRLADLLAPAGNGA